MNHKELNEELETLFMKYKLKKHSSKFITDRRTGIITIMFMLHDQNKTITNAVCEFCKKDFSAVRSTAQFCSAKCRVASHRKNKK